jgi:hypothetical protein
MGDERQRSPRRTSAADAINALTADTGDAPSRFQQPAVTLGNSLPPPVPTGGDPGQPRQVVLSESDIANLFSKFSEMASSLTMLTQQLQQQQQQTPPNLSDLSAALTSAASTAARAATVESLASMSTNQPGSSPMDESDSEDLGSFSIAKLKQCLGKPVSKQVHDAVNVYKAALADIDKQKKKIIKLEADLTAIEAGKFPAGYKPFRCGPGPPLFDDACGDNASMAFTLQPQWSYRTAKENALLHHHRIIAFLDKSHATKLRAQLSSECTFENLMTTCRDACSNYDSKFDSISGPPGLISTDQLKAVELGTKLYKQVMVGIQFGNDKIEQEKAKLDNKKASILEEVTSMTKEQLDAAVSWQHAGAAKSLKFNSAIDYIKIAEGTVPTDVSEILKCDSNVDDVLAQSSKRRFTKSELSMSKSGGRLSPGAAQGHNGKDSPKGLGKGKDTKGKGKGKGKGKDSALAGKAKGKGKGLDPKGKPTQDAAKAGGKGGKSGKRK